MRTEKIVPILQELPFLHNLSPALRARVAGVLLNISEQRKVPGGGVWLHEHDHDKNRGFVLLKGEVRITKSESPEIHCIAPELLGELMQFMPAHERTATVSAITDSIVLRFLWDDFWNRLDAEFTEEEVKQIRETLENTAWRHLAG